MKAHIGHMLSRIGMQGALVIGWAGVVSAAVINVPAGGDIAAAVAEAQQDDIVQLAAGVYTLSAQVSVSKGVEVRGAGRLLTRIVSDGRAHGLFSLNHADAVLSHVTVADAKNTGGNGSGVLILAGTLADSIVSGCTSKHGGGVYAQNGAVRRCMLVDNTATAYGGAVRVAGGGEVTLENVLVYGNSASWGGGLYTDGGSKVTIVNCTFSGDNKGTYETYIDGNTGWIMAVNTHFGGNLRLNGSSSRTTCSSGDVLFASKTTRNYRPGAQSTLLAAGSPVEYTRDLDGNAFADNPAIGAYQPIAVPVFELLSDVRAQESFDVTVRFPSGVEGDGTLVLVCPDGSMTETAVENGQSVSVAADVCGIYSFALVVTEDGGSIFYCDEPNAFSASVAEVYVNPRSANPVPPYATPETAAVNISDTFAYVPDGGTVWLEEGDGYELVSTVVIDRPLTIKGRSGCGPTVISGTCDRLFTLSHPDAVLSGLVLRGTRSTSSSCVGFQSFGGRMEDCIVEGFVNQGGSGGAVVSSGAACMMERCVIRNNTARSYGGGVLVAGGRIDMRNCLFYGNSAKGNYGSAIYAQGAGTAVSIVNCTVFNNAAAVGQFYGDSGSLFVATNCIFGSVSGRLTRDSCVVGTTDPGFVSASDGDYRLKETATTLIDKGNDAAVFADEYDLRGEVRKQGEHVDIGCCELPVESFSAYFEIDGTATAVGDTIRLVPTVIGGVSPVNNWLVINDATGEELEGETSGSGDEAAFVITLNKAGVYSFFHSAAEGGKTASSERSQALVVRTTGDVYVAPSGTPVAPFDTPEKALVDPILAERLVPDGATIRLLEGTHVLSSRLMVARGIRLVGAGRDKTVLTCEADSRHGLLALDDADALVSDLTLTGDFGTAYTDGNGAGVRITAGTLSDCLMTNLSQKASLSMSGTAVSISGGAASRLSRVEIRGCSGGQGGTIYATDCRIDNCLVYDNASGSSGAGISVAGANSAAAVSNCTFVGTQASYVYTVSAAAKFVNCIFDCPVNTGTTPSGAAVFFACASSAGHPIPGAGNLDQIDLGFLDKANENFHLSVDSPCRRVGRFEPWLRRTMDLDGRRRTAGGRVDLGCYQDSRTGLLLQVR